MVSGKMKDIKGLRTHLKMSQSQFGQYFGIPLRTVQNWESGQSSPPLYVIDMMNRIIGLEEEVSGLAGRSKNLIQIPL